MQTYDSVCVLVLEENVKAVDEVSSVERITTNT